MEFLSGDGCWSSVSAVLHIAMQGRAFMCILGVALCISLDVSSYIGGIVLNDGRMGKRGRSRRFALLSARRGATLLSYSQLFRKLLMPMKTLADWRERRNDVHSVGLRART